MKHIQPSTAMFTGAAGNRLVADVFGDTGQPVLLLHGGGQTRHAWGRTAEHLARAGATAYALDQRGHGDSEWVADGHYAFADFAADAAAVARTLAAAHRAAADRDRRLARRHGVAARGRHGGAQRARGRCSPRSCWSTSRRASTRAASRRSRASCASAPRKALRPSRKPPTRSPPICRIASARARMTG